MNKEKFETFIDKQRYTFIIWGNKNMWSANAYINGKCVDGTDSENGSDDVILKLVKLLEK